MSTEIAKKEDGALAGFDLASLGDFSGAVTARRELIRVPRVSLVQGGSEASKSRKAMPGDFYCQLTGENFGTSLTIIPLLINESAALMDKAHPDNPKISRYSGKELVSHPLCSTKNLRVNLDGENCKQCPYNEFWADWGTKDKMKVPACKTSIDVTCLVVKGNEISHVPMQFSFRKESHKSGVDLLSSVAYHPHGIPFLYKYTLITKAGGNSDFDYLVVARAPQRSDLTPEQVGFVAPIAKMILDANKAGGLEVENEDINVDTKETDKYDDDLPI